MKLFEPNAEGKSYSLPIFKTFICLVILLVSGNLKLIGNWLGAPEWIWKVLAHPIAILITFVISISTILCLYVAIGEIIFVTNNKFFKDKQIDVKSVNFLAHKKADVFSMIQENDIIDVAALINNSVIKIGSSSDYKHSTGVFFDKRYYIDGTEYLAFEDFEKEMDAILPGDEIQVYSIDDVKCV